MQTTSFQTEQKTILPLCSVDASVERLTGVNWLDEVIMLHTAARAQTGPSDLPVLVPKPAAYFADLLEGKGGKLLGCFVGGKLVGLTAVQLNKNFATAHQEGALTCPDLSTDYPSGPVAIIQSVCVLAAYTRFGFCKNLLAKAVSVAREHGCMDAFAQIAAHNTKSLRVFEKASFARVTTWQTDYSRVLVHKHLTD